MALTFLIGFMAAGKTSVGQALAKQSGWRFVDLDDEIAKLGEPVAELVARDEPEFRRREAATLAALIANARDEGIVVATGGGAAAYGDNLERMRAAGCVVALDVDVETARQRAGDPSSRPLLQRGDAAIAALAAARAPIYRRANIVVDTHGRTIAEVVAQVADASRAYMGPASTVVALGARSYPVVVTQRFDPAVLARLGSVTKVALVTDTNVAHYWRAEAERTLLPDATVVMPAGEAHKTLATYEHVCDQLIAAGLDRSSAILALGGGVVGDLAGFVAATLFRGIAVVQLPTTLVAMVDAAIGGKTAVDTAAGKNLIGAFWQPKLVACNLATLATLPQRERRAGFGELWKYALLDGPALWDAVERCASWATDGGELPSALHEAITRSIAFKAAVVGRDERERTGVRALLNLGHTVGHAIESHTGMLHGEAVGLGLVVACRVSTALGLASPGLSRRVADALQRTGLPHDPNTYLTDDVLARLHVDKKRVADRVRFIAIREVGACEPVDIPLAELARILRLPNTP
ncbi:MAG TPA: 3-dehydroquinate synthase [Kofleriaceae bacterium]|nr:3-dehydroquinate synthase [Kofleriaceae bacterium]